MARKDRRRKRLLGFRPFVERDYGLRDAPNPYRAKYGSRRVCSWIRLCRTSVARDIAAACHFGRMPVPSEDTLIWRWCERLKLRWMRWNFKAAGWTHYKRNYAEMCLAAEGAK